MIDFFVLSWKRVFKNAYQQFNIIKDINPNTYFVNCDPTIELDGNNIFNLSNLYYGSQFQFAVNNFNNEILGILAGDASSVVWSDIFHITIEYFKKDPSIGIFAPYCDMQPHQIKKQPYDSDTFFVDNTDCTAWFINKRLIDIFNLIGVSWGKNPLGWGIDKLLCKTAYKLNMPVLVNYKYIVKHPWVSDGSKTGYSTEIAEYMMKSFLRRNRHFKILI